MENTLAGQQHNISQQRWDLILRGMDAAPWDWDLVTGEVYLSRNWWNRLGYLGGTITDLTERQQVAAKLQDSEARYRALVECSPIGIGVHQNGLVVFANPAAVSILGAKNEAELIGLPINDLIDPRWHSIVADRVARGLPSGTPLPVQVEKFIRCDGQFFGVEVQAVSVTHRGKPVIQVNFVDVTAHENTETTLRESEARFRALAELSSDRLLR